MGRNFFWCALAIAALWFGAALPAAGQGSAMDKGSSQRKPDAASKPTPRLPDGHPDLNGVWHHYFGEDAYQPLKPGQSANFDFNKISDGAPITAMKSKPEYKMEYVAKVADLDKRQNETDQNLRCGAPGVPRLGPPNQIVQTRGQVVFLYADVNGEFFRVIPTDGRALAADQEASYNGDAVGHWVGDTLIVDGSNFTDDSWMADDGLIHSDKMHVVEKLQRKGDTLQYDVTVSDAVMLAKPWVMDSRTLVLQDDILQQAPPCIDHDVDHLRDLSHHSNER
jgi:hypothetical protein